MSKIIFDQILKNIDYLQFTAAIATVEPASIIPLGDTSFCNNDSVACAKNANHGC